MKITGLIAGALLGASIIVGTVADAAPLPGVTDPYTGEYQAGSVVSGNPHVFWTPLLASTHNEKFWNFQNDYGVFKWDGPLTAGNQATLTGTIVNFANSNWKFTMSVDFTFIEKGGRSHGANTLKCEFSSTLCNSAAYTNTSSNFEFFSTSGTLTGGGDLAGFDLSFDTFPEQVNGVYPMPMQLGYGANNKPGGTSDESALETFGLSTWLTLSVVNNNGSVFNLQDFAPGTTFTGSGQRGDINLELTPVPLPAALPLLLAGIAGLGLVGRRRQTTT